MPAAHDLPSCAAAACAAGVAAFGINASGFCFIGDQGKWDSTPAFPELGTAYRRNASGWPPSAYRQAGADFDDSSWQVVDLPHDASARTPHTPSAASGQGFRPPVVAMYRKHFALPLALNGSAITLVVEGAQTSSSWWLNGQQLLALQMGGSLPIVLRLDNVGAPLRFGAQGTNILAVWTDSTHRTGWWEEGAGLLRGRARLLVAPAEARLAVYGVACPAFVNGTIRSRGGAPSDGLVADTALLFPSANITTGEGFKGHQNVTIEWALSPLSNASRVVVARATATVPVPGGGATSRIAGQLLLKDAQLWSVARPALYTLQTQLWVNGSLLDSAEDVIGVRDIAWDGSVGLRLNGAPTKLRGWCDHETWGGLGGALPERVALFRMQQLRGVGGNAYRSSHNPPAPHLLDVADRLGVVVLDENRILATTENAGPRNDTWGWRDLPISYTGGSIQRDAGMLAARDRLHASVAFFSICNELGCGGGGLLDGDLVLSVKAALDASDGSRAMTGNMGWQSPEAVEAGSPISDVFDVMGMSHQSPAVLQAYHAAAPFKAVVMSECCSCETQRGEDADLVPFRNASAAVTHSSTDEGCFERETQWSNTPYCVGTMIWTLHDYGGEPDTWPHVSSSFGVFDYAGFPKPTAWWFRSWWLANVSASDPSRPSLPLPPTQVYCKLVESWAPSPNNSRVIHVFSNAPTVALSISGAPFATAPVDHFGSALFPAVPFTPGSTLEATCTLPNGGGSATDASTLSTGALKIVLTLDAPSLATGTGFGRVYSDGLDVALVRATIVDSAGHVCAQCSHALTFSLAAPSAGALITGAHNGDPAWQGTAADEVPAYHGLARVVVRSTVDASGTDEERALRASVNVDAGKGRESSSVWVGGAPPPAAFTILAAAPGLEAASLTVALSRDPADSVLASAQASVQLADWGE